ncbi:D-3-phosphoglycerate dehydrogenase 2 [Marasmius tenuissimus]|uniref:D-3-phosphoglycerate dehydrogenase 2 n=1 Tax=Marasmius tenuissimus TaxID=585030 RepID=A0ABR2ZZ50_9AGAR
MASTFQTKSSAPLRLLLLENVSQRAVRAFRERGFHVDHLTKSISEDELIKRIGTYHGVGIRSKTRITPRVLEHAPLLQVVACFCIGTDQVDIAACTRLNIPVFNSPFSNSRSVAELVVGQIIALARNLFERSSQIPVWNKQSDGSYQVLGKTLGIIGYGHIGSQVSVLAHALGMRVLFYDVINPIMTFGSAVQLDTLDEVLSQSDFVTLHVPSTPNLISYPELKKMKKGACLINDSRGCVVDLPALAAVLDEGHLAGAALDVFPNEPSKNGQIIEDPVVQRLRKMRNVILTPHIGGSTEEAQTMIGDEVAGRMGEFLAKGIMSGAVNEATLKEQEWPVQSRMSLAGVEGIISESFEDGYQSVSRRPERDGKVYMMRGARDISSKL